MSSHISCGQAWVAEATVIPNQQVLATRKSYGNTSWKDWERFYAAVSWKKLRASSKSPSNAVNCSIDIWTAKQEYLNKRILNCGLKK